MVTSLKNKDDLELFGYKIKTCFQEIPDNLRLLIIVNNEDFFKLSHEINPHHIPTDRFIYMTKVGIELGIKLKQ